MSYSIEVGGFSSLEEGWRGLLQACSECHVFFSPGWHRTWWQHFGVGRELLLLSVHRGGELVGIAPLMREGDTISLVGSDDVCDYMDFIARPGEEKAFLTAVLDHLEPLGWRQVELHSLLPHSVALGHLVPLARERGHHVETAQEDVSPQLMLPTHWDDYLEGLTRKDRHEMRRKMRRLSQEGYRFSMVEGGEGLHRDMEDFFSLFARGRDEKRGFMTDQMRGFFRDMASATAEEGYLRLAFLEVAGERVAAALCFDCRDHLHLYNSGYDPAHSALSVGLLCKALCIREGILQGKRRFDFLRGAESYKYHMGGEDVPLYRCLVSRR